MAWPRLPVASTLESAYGKLLGPNGLFREDAAAKLQAGKEFALTSTTGEKLSGQAELVKKPRGVCLRITEWKDALLWATIGGSEGQLNAQLWISMFGLPQSKVDEFNVVWSDRLKSILG